MILFKKIKFRNLLSSGNTPTEICFIEASTNLILGTNGSGKCFCINTKIRLRNKKTGEIIETTVGEFYEAQEKQNDSRKD
jgi:ABC-type cobalamin/Fe3+-siderophores transport system ATPase subunit